MAPQSISYIKLCLLSFLVHPIYAIIYGVDAPEGSAPWAAALITKGAAESFICGGALISSSTILTTAECVDNQSPSSLSVRLGSLDRTNGGTVKDATKITKHPKYNSKTLDSNFAVIHLSDDVSDISTLDIAENSPRSGIKLTMYGWGSTDRTSQNQAKSLQQLGTFALSGESCRHDWRDLRDITSTMMCDVPDAGAGPCTGDQGGPIVSEGKLVALITSLNQCNHSDHPDVDSDVAAVRDWILSFRK